MLSREKFENDIRALKELCDNNLGKAPQWKLVQVHRIYSILQKSFTIFFLFFIIIIKKILFFADYIQLRLL